MTPIKTVVFGATGYVGGELLRLITAHPTFELAAAVSQSRADQPIADTFAHLAGALGKEPFVGYERWLEKFASGDQLALFSAAPHGASATLIRDALAAASDRNLEVHVVDASADFRYPTAAAWEAVYGGDHGAPELLDQFACAVPEHLPSTDAQHVGHPGCFATSAMLAAWPLASAGLTDGEVDVWGITGSTGSGRSPQAGTHHPVRHSNLYAYKPLQHRHAPEIAAALSAAGDDSIRVNFVPHSGPFARGIHTTVMARSPKPVSTEELVTLFETTYAASPFVRVVAGTPRLKDVVASNYAYLGVESSGDRLVVMCVIDNLLKGAAGGAMQWMNRLWQLPQDRGLTTVAPAWT